MKLSNLEGSKSPKQDIETILSNLSKDELIKIILNTIQQYPELEQQLLFEYATADREIPVCKRMIKGYISRAKHKGVISWDKARYAMEGAWQALDKARRKLEDGNAVEAIQLSILVLSIVVDTLEYCDDSDGSVGTVIYEAIIIISEAADEVSEKAPPVKQKKVLDMIINEALEQRYDEWTDWRFDLLQVCVDFCGVPEFRSLLEKQLEEMLKNISKKDYEDKYNIRRIKLLQLAIIEGFDSFAQAKGFINDNIKFSEFREKAVTIALEKGQYEEAVRICLEGEEVDRGYHGLIGKWKKYRYLAYEKSGDIENRRKLALEMIFRDEFDYFLKLKTLYRPEDWQLVSKNIISKLEERTYKGAVYVDILIEEGLTPKLLEYCQENISTIEHMYPHLIERYYEETNQIFIEYIRREAVAANKRSKYRRVCAKIKLYKKVFGKARAEELISDFKQTFGRRPAFVDELGKIK